jgi:hypothetical protein
MAISSQQAEIIAIKAVEWLGATDDLLMVFLGASGMDIKDLVSGTTDPAVLAGVLDFVLMDDDFIRQFCEFSNLSMDTPFQARQSLPGGEQMHWT